MAASAPQIQKPDYSLLQRWMREGMRRQIDFAPIAGYATQTRATVTAGTFTTSSAAGGSNNNVDLGRAWVITHAHMSADTTCVLGIQYGQSAFTAAIPESFADLCGTATGGGRVDWHFPHGLLLPEFTSFNFGLNPPTTSAPFTSGGAHCYSITADFDYEAPAVILFIGDSITFAQIAGANGTSQMNGNNGFPMIVRNHLISKGVRVRHINKGISGLTSPQALVKANNNETYRCVEEKERVVLIIDALNMNDAATPISFASQAAFNATYNAIYTNGGLLDYYPGAELIAMSHTGTNDNAGGRVTNSGTIRGYKQGWVSGLSASYAARTHFADGTLAYGGSGGGSATADGSIDAATYLAEASNQIHPNIAGHAAIVTNVLGPAIANSNWGKRVLPSGW